MKDLEQELFKHREKKFKIAKEISYKSSPDVVIQKVQKNYNWSLEAAKIKELSCSGMTLQEIGNLYEVSREMIRQVLKKHFPSLSKKEKGSAIASEKKRKQYLSSLYARTGRYTAHHADDLSRAMSKCFTRKKQNAKRGKWGWALTPTDVQYPSICPILGIELDWFAEYTQENSPSFDRVDSTKGYIPGNVIICSWRANRIKNDGTAEEHRKISEFLETKLK